LRGQPEPELGNYLSDFKNELSENNYIVEFASGGTKNYGYQTKKGKQECKVRGISQNSKGSKQLNFPVLRQNVLDDILKPLANGARQTIVVKPYHIVCNRKAYSIETVPQTKEYQLVLNKRVTDPQRFMTYPYDFQPALDDHDMDNVNLLMEL